MRKKFLPFYPQSPGLSGMGFSTAGHGYPWPFVDSCFTIFPYFCHPFIKLPMSIIQTIRDKAAWLVFGLIALSLIGFLLMDAFVGRSRLFGNRSTVIGVVNGQDIEYNAFEKQVSELEEQARQQNYQADDATLREQVWQETVDENLLNKDYDDLGIQVGDKEQNDMLVGNNPIPDVKQAFTDKKTGMFDAQAASQQISQLRSIWKAGPKRNTDPRTYEMARAFFEQRMPIVIKERMREKYMSLLGNSAYVPKWMIEKMNADNTQLASISFVNTPYLTISDSSIKISPEEIQQYIDEHKDKFKQEESRSIAYVTFNDAPSSADSARVRQELTDLSKDFAKTTDLEGFINRVGSDESYSDHFNAKSKIKVPFKDSIFALPKGGVYGPYLDAGNYTIAKKVDEQTIPDSVHARHILVQTYDPQTKQTLMEDSVAKKKIDSAVYQLEHGGNWDSVALKYSDDGSKTKGGDLGWFTQESMVPEFADFCFTGKKGDKKVVKTMFGYHYVEILDQKNFEPGYKIAYVTRKIQTSPETDQAASGLASQFAGESRDAKSFQDNADKEHLLRMIAPDITPAEFAIPGLGVNRQFVRWIYEADLGNVSEPFSIGDKYVVAVVTEINNEGTMSVAKARNRVEPLLRNRKKADQIIKKLGTPASLEAVASASGVQVSNIDSVHFANPFLPNAGQEPKVTGASFDKQLLGKPISPAIPGNSGVFFIKVNNVSAMSNPNADIQQQRFVMEQQMRNVIYRGLMEDLHNLSTIKDYRSKFF
jgi:peptidyl-prolyl cis-trans isomerase D